MDHKCVTTLWKTLAYNAKLLLSSLPLELFLLIPANLKYASTLNAMSQTCRQIYAIINTQLYSKVAKISEPNILRPVETGNSDALIMLGSAGHKFSGFLETSQVILRVPS
ncbi:SirA-like [Penicillium digitatum]|uniref:SirA-like n=1 Tax=Penicillium digitatum TaxID=36651 RepID=A0A7T6XJZ3_PENDI|nr:SirA-like [Penicillium digitatum]